MAMNDTTVLASFNTKSDSPRGIDTGTAIFMSVPTAQVVCRDNFSGLLQREALSISFNGGEHPRGRENSLAKIA